MELEENLLPPISPTKVFEDLNTIKENMALERREREETEEKGCDEGEKSPKGHGSKGLRETSPMCQGEKSRGGGGVNKEKEGVVKTPCVEMEDIKKGEHEMESKEVISENEELTLHDTSRVELESTKENVLCCENSKVEEESSKEGKLVEFRGGNNHLNKKLLLMPLTLQLFLCFLNLFRSLKLNL